LDYASYLRVLLTWASFAFVMVVQNWWAYFELLQSQVWVNMFAFMLPLVVFVLLYLICASSLPDVRKVPENGSVVLGRFYFEQRRYLFGRWGALLCLAVIVSWIARGRLDVVGADGFRMTVYISLFTLTL
jgi:hypothetical protein